MSEVPVGTFLGWQTTSLVKGIASFSQGSDGTNPRMDVDLPIAEMVHAMEELSYFHDSQSHWAEVEAAEFQQYL